MRKLIQASSVSTFIVLAGCGGGGGGGSTSGTTATQSASSSSTADIVIPATPKSAEACNTASASKAVGPFIVHNNCIAHLKIGSADYNTLTNKPSTEIQVFVDDFQKAFQDNFDFITLVLDTGTSTPINTNAEYGIYRSRDVRVPTRTSRLLGSLILPYSQGITQGPMLHEVAHEWATKATVPFLFNGQTIDSSHWGISSAYGQLGGFDPLTLTNEGQGRYSASVQKIYPSLSANADQSSACYDIGVKNLSGFNVNANGGNTIPYGNAERYLMGLLPSSLFETFQVAKNPRTDAVWVNNQPSNKTYFLADGFTSMDEAAFRAAAGRFAPKANQGQRDFRMAFVVLSTSADLSASKIADYTSQINQFTTRGDVPSMRRTYSVANNPKLTSVDCLVSQNFFTATFGGASMSPGGLVESAK